MSSFDPGLAVYAKRTPLDILYGPDCFGPRPELRSLDSIRQSLFDPQCEGPDPVYAIAMDVGRKIHHQEIVQRNLLFGMVVYAGGRLGTEPVRSQGHIHQPSPRHGWSPPELYEIWQGQAVILMQESAGDDPGRCFAIQAGPGDVVMVPPAWAHATISANPTVPLVFGAWCDRDYGFCYEGVRAHQGLAWYPLLDEQGHLTWRRNPTYLYRELRISASADYSDFGLDPGVPIYQQFADNHDRFQFVVEPQRFAALWENFSP